MKLLLETICGEVSVVLSRVKAEECAAWIEAMRRSKRIFVAGEGRSGLMGKAFAMRLMHAGFQSYAVGETITPSMGPEDLLVALSGSGTTETVLLYARQAGACGASLVAITTNGQSPLAALGDVSVVVQAATKRRAEGEPPTIQPLGNQFDQSLHLLLDAAVMQLLKETVGYKESELAGRHSNLQ